MPVSISSAPYVLNSNEILTLAIAAYAAIVSTFVLGWDAYKWLALGEKIDLSASMGMKIYGGVVPDENTYISVTALNVGDRPTTITNLGGMYFESWWGHTSRAERLRKRLLSLSRRRRSGSRTGSTLARSGSAWRFRTVRSNRRRGMDICFLSSTQRTVGEGGESGSDLERRSEKSKLLRQRSNMSFDTDTRQQCAARRVDKPSAVRRTAGACRSTPTLSRRA